MCRLPLPLRVYSRTRERERARQSSRSRSGIGTPNLWKRRVVREPGTRKGVRPLDVLEGEFG